MKYVKTYLPSFTMMDVLTGMVIMSLVVVMVFYLLSATMGQAVNYQGVRFDLNEYLLLKGDLKRSAEKGFKLEPLPAGFRISGFDTYTDYVQSDQFLLRKTEFSLDTLSHHLVSVKSFPLDENPEGETLLSGVEVVIKVGEQPLKCYLYKEYGLAEPLNQKLIREY